MINTKKFSTRMKTKSGGEVNIDAIGTREADILVQMDTDHARWAATRLTVGEIKQLRKELKKALEVLGK
ncbi:hypothetical protein [Mycolicibacterium palauense]|uniref:hypothetical protein n=1 Tax=Mycolicibacterium palauense TaxID=2034511 RepID=UPI000BFEC33C|nr:hypothetical protein [Mycolicibacterium palauense]